MWSEQFELGRRVMVGRERELRSLLGGLEDASSRRGRLFLISGEPGVGKTRLADEVAAEAHAKRMAVLVGHCSEHDEAVAYLPFVEILENFVDRASNQNVCARHWGIRHRSWRACCRNSRASFPGFLHRSICHRPGAAPSVQLLLRLPLRVASEQPALMILEDLHWADDSTLSLLDHLPSGFPICR